jgi:hypothetical protein
MHTKIYIFFNFKLLLLVSLYDVAGPKAPNAAIERALEAVRQEWIAKVVGVPTAVLEEE